MSTSPLSGALRATALAGACLGAAAVGAPSASAAAVTVPGKCYVSWPGEASQQIPVTVAGLTAAQNVRVSLVVKKQLVSGIPQLTADSTGSVVSPIANWTSGLGSGPTRSTDASVVVNDLTSGAELAKADFKVANVGFKFDGAKKRAGVKRNWEISGLASWGESQGGGKVYYAYYFRGDKQVGKQRLGKAQDACGYVKAKKVLIPFKKTGIFDLKVQASRTWKGDDLPWIGTRVQSLISYR